MREQSVSTVRARASSVLGMDLSALPDRMRSLPLDSAGRPVPYFVAWLASDAHECSHPEHSAGDCPSNCRPDFRVMSSDHYRRALTYGLCWVCGAKRGRTAAFTVGPMCVVNLISAEPPAHRECAVFSATHCPFLTNPAKGRRYGGLPEGYSEPGGIMLERNPGVCAVVMSCSFAPFRVEPAPDVSSGILFDIGLPLEVMWFSEGREATRAEVLASLDSGMPALREACDTESSVKKRASAHAALDIQFERAMRWVPA